MEERKASPTEPPSEDALDIAGELLDFATKRGKSFSKFRCWVCGIVEREQIDSALREGVSPYAIKDWLVLKKGYSADLATYHRVKGHKDRGHHER